MRELPADWAPAPLDRAPELDPDSLWDALLWLVATVCGLCLGLGLELLLGAA